ncbi:MAG TPA: NAD(P)H-dependent glycerol-3-phosphate dehydrogenase [Gemmatimonadales bacterium]|nr:NAD(P)H-dependent glycerol-3-phosphate dehydrogenase [Gemmatimonadales bacterium]
MSRVAVLGAGSWGTTLADLLARKGLEVRLWAYEAEVVEAINAHHENTVFLPGAPLAPTLRACADRRGALAGADVVLSAAPSHAVRSVIAPVADAIPPGTLVVSATKGLETDSLKPMSTVLGELLPAARIAVLSGPSFAEEVYRGQPTAVVAASRDPGAAEEAQRIFATPRFRVYTNPDVIGVELAGALKNVIAIAAGILEGLGLGHNPRAALITRGLAEMTRLGLALGAEPATFAGLAGMGDLILTTCGALSRNRALGLALARGESLAAYTATHRSVAEGVNTARAAVALGERTGVELPVAAQVCAILFDGKSPERAVSDLMERALKPEQWR